MCIHRNGTREFYSGSAAKPHNYNILFSTYPWEYDIRTANIDLYLRMSKIGRWALTDYTGRTFGICNIIFYAYVFSRNHRRYKLCGCNGLNSNPSVVVIVGTVHNFTYCAFYCMQLTGNVL